MFDLACAREERVRCRDPGDVIGDDLCRDMRGLGVNAVLDLLRHPPFGSPAAKPSAISARARPQDGRGVRLLVLNDALDTARFDQRRRARPQVASAAGETGPAHPSRGWPERPVRRSLGADALHQAERCTLGADALHQAERCTLGTDALGGPERSAPSADDLGLARDSEARSSAPHRRTSNAELFVGTFTLGLASASNRTTPRPTFGG
jgi:hypothetical protein